MLKLPLLHKLFHSRLEYLSIKQKLYAGFGLLLVFMLVIVVVTVIGLFLVRSNINAVVKEYEPTASAAIKLGKHIKQASGSLGMYLLSKEEIHQKTYKAALGEIDTTLTELKQLETMQDDADSMKLVLGIETDINKFKQYQTKLFKLAVSGIQNFPGILFSARNLNPISHEILSELYNMIQTEKDEPANQVRKNILLDIESVRYSWTNVMNGIRIFLADRGDGAISNLALYKEKALADIQNLETRVNKHQYTLDFDQQASFENILSLKGTFFNNLEKMIKIHSSEKWRTDAYLIRTEIGPLLRTIDEKLNRLEKNSRNKIDSASAYLLTEVVVIIIIMLALLAAAFYTASRVSIQLIKAIVAPLNAAVAATGSIASGDLTVSLEETSEDEIGQLISSLNMMAVNLSSLVSSVQNSGIQVTSSSTEISATAKQQEATATQQAATANEISATAKEISATVSELVSTMDEVTSVTETTTHAAANSQSALASMEQTMHQMMNATSSIGSKLSVLSEKASNINSVVTTITKVADQTNLLSLNAAIEAEKAGEYGIGFSVVATEIRRLADQTAVATWDIEQMVKEMQTAVSAGVMGMDKFSEEVRNGVDEVRHVGAQLADIIEQVQALLPRFEAVHEGMQQQALGARQITESISQLSDGTQQTVESLRQSSSSINQLHNAARSLQDGVSKFKVKRA